MRWMGGGTVLSGIMFFKERCQMLQRAEIKGVESNAREVDIKVDLTSHQLCLTSKVLFCSAISVHNTAPLCTQPIVGPTSPPPHTHTHAHTHTVSRRRLTKRFDTIYFRMGLSFSILPKKLFLSAISATRAIWNRIAMSSPQGAPV